MLQFQHKFNQIMLNTTRKTGKIANLATLHAKSGNPDNKIHFLEFELNIFFKSKQILPGYIP